MIDLTTIINRKNVLVIGAGVTGSAVVKALVESGKTVVVYDENRDVAMKNMTDDVPCFDTLDQLLKVDFAITSPGFSPRHAVMRWLRHEGIPVISDIEYALLISRPKQLVAITGTNGKTTVCCWLTNLLQRAGLSAQACGNVGVPLAGKSWGADDIAVCELSSYQLARTRHLRPDVSVVLNVQPDHMVWHQKTSHYQACKHRIHRDSECRVEVRGERGLPANYAADITIGTDSPSHAFAYGVMMIDGDAYLARGDKCLLPVTQLPWYGPATVMNALAVWALANRCGLKDNLIAKHIGAWEGLPYRCQRVVECHGRVWFNDSKATNPHATATAIEALAARPDVGDIVLMVGGLVKSNQFDQLDAKVKAHVKAVVAFGRDRGSFFAAWHPWVPITLANDLKSAVKVALSVSKSGDTILFSPAAASFDAFRDYNHRGETFNELVQAYCRVTS